MKLRTQLGLLVVSAALAACSSTAPEMPAPTVANTSNDEAGFALKGRASQAAGQVLSSYAFYDAALRAAKSGDDATVSQFLAMQTQGAMAENVRNEWLKTLGKRGDWVRFQQELAQLDAAARSQEVRCYADGIAGGKMAAELVLETGKLSEGCTRLVESRAMSLNQADAWRRVRGLIAANQLTDARALAAALGSPLGGSGQGYQENLLLDVIGKESQKSAASGDRLAALEANGALTREQAGFAWGVLGLNQARNQNFGAALNFYNRALRSQLNKEQFEWYARSALRFSQWNDLVSIINDMPSALKNEPTWLYWLGRSYAALGDSARAQDLYRQAAKTGRNFYAVMATEELGNRINTKNNVSPASNSQLQQLAQDGAINRALTLFQNSQATGDGTMRRVATQEWRYATRDMNENTKLAAAQLAYNNQFYDMAVNTAESTDRQLNYDLRYISPFREITERYAAQAGIDTAWVYGLIRQESRFVMGAKSHVGAQGLMQVMPATAREIAGKIGMDSSQLYTMDGNIRMGTWYLGDAKRRLQNNEVMATAGYNAGPGRSRQWQANVPLEGAIYAETIPFTETRDYVKKVLTNATYYASIFKQPHTSLKQRMGVVPAK
ncbi:MAG: transglycosylase SLT domain-containing protein [Neisseria sp.]|nr:transglycosylase SLT domain-containing protein [Neisseria sp.]